MVSNEGIEALTVASDHVSQACETVMQLTAALESAASDDPEALGPHAGSLANALEAIRSAVGRAKEPADEVSRALNSLAQRYREIIDDDPFANDDPSGGSFGSASSAGGAGASSASGTSSGGMKFGSFNVGRYDNGDYVIQGDNFDSYMSDYYDSESLSYESLTGSMTIETISPSQIEGIHLGDSEVSDSGVFWRQHDSQGTADSFMEIASHIPEVRAQLDSGKSLSAIGEDPALSQCVSIYFEPSNIPRVVKNDGYYEFDSNGRHRILAARELGYDIPVRVIGRRSRKQA